MMGIAQTRTLLEGPDVLLAEAVQGAVVVDLAQVRALRPAGVVITPVPSQGAGHGVSSSGILGPPCGPIRGGPHDDRHEPAVVIVGLDLTRLGPALVLLQRRVDAGVERARFPLPDSQDLGHRPAPRAPCRTPTADSGVPEASRTP
jgi:hypothetical protein